MTQAAKSMTNPMRALNDMSPEIAYRLSWTNDDLPKPSST
jgi:hypothetical protein